MNKYIKNVLRWIGLSVLTLLAPVLSASSVFADGYALTVSPMSQKMILNPGEVAEGSFKISNPASSTHDTYYEIEVEPFYKNDNNEFVFQAEGDMGEIAKWITFDVPTSGKLAPNEVKEITFKVNVPKDAPAGGQYASIATTSKSKSSDEEDENAATDSTTIKEIRRMAHLVYAEVTGATIKTGEIFDAKVPSFLLSGKITGSSSVKNTGNVHGTATYKLQVFPLFSSEEIYTNEENPDTATVLPNRTVYSESSWDETPMVGIFNVVYTVEFEGAKAEVKKMVIVCPVWLLFLIIFIIAAIIIYFVARARRRSKKNAD